ncbi:MAG: DUF167 domain-containing protein [Acidobacteriota bacterium]|nr:DUF167 domain-containing protein [Acidobacteriota bacterium]
MMIEARTTRDGAITFPVHVSPRAKRNAIEGVSEGALRVRLAAPPIEGRANDVLCRFLAECLNIPRSTVRIVAGERSRRKRVEVRGISLSHVLALVPDVSQETAGKQELTGDRPAARRGGESS